MKVCLDVVLEERIEGGLLYKGELLLDISNKKIKAIGLLNDVNYAAYQALVSGTDAVYEDSKRVLALNCIYAVDLSIKFNFCIEGISFPALCKNDNITICITHPGLPEDRFSLTIKRAFLPNEAYCEKTYTQIYTKCARLAGDISEVIENFCK